jgi:chaperonin GroES
MATRPGAADDIPRSPLSDDQKQPLETNSIMNIRPLYDRIVVKRIEEQETTRHGIIIPDSAKEKPQEGEVMAVGHGKRLEDGKLVALDVKAGDRILFAKYSGSETKLEGTEYIIMREDDILGVLDSAAKAVKK